MKQLLTNSALAKTACPRKYQLSYILGIRRDVDHVNLRFGTAVHLALEHYANGGDADTAAHAAIAEFDASAGEFEIDMYERAKIWVLLTEYFAYWPRLEHVATEMEFRYPLRNPETGRSSRTWDLAGKLDGVIQLAEPDGRLAVLEHKTTAFDVQDPDCAYWKKLRINSQVSIYFTAARVQGHNVQTTIYNVIRKPGQKPKQLPMLDNDRMPIVLDADGNRAIKKNGEPYRTGNAAKGLTLQTRIETPDEYAKRIRELVHAAPQVYFIRQEIPRLQGDLDEAATDLWLTSQMLNFCAAKNCYPKRPSQCVGFGTCEFFDLCTGGYDPESGDIPDGYLKLDNVHPELSEVGSETDD